MFGQQNIDAWIGHDTGGVFEFPTEGRMFQYMNLGGSKQIAVGYWQVSFYSWIVGGAFVLIGLILRKTSWENKLTLVIIGLFVASAYALKDYDLVLNGLNVAAFGLIGMLAIWMISGMMALAKKLAPTPQPVDKPTMQPVAVGAAESNSESDSN